MRTEATGSAGMPPALQAKTAAEPIRLAQAQGNASDAFVLPPPEKVTTLKPVPLGGGMEGTAYRLPEGASFDTIRLVTVDGQQVLALVQADGSVLVLEGTGPVPGAATPAAEVPVPTLIVGDVEIPREALAAAFQSNGIQPAAGDAAVASSGADFSEPVPDIGSGLAFRELLGPTEFSLDFPTPRDGLLDLGGNGAFGNGAFGIGAPGNGALVAIGPQFTGGLIGLTGTPVTDGSGAVVGGLPSGGLRLDQAAIAKGTHPDLATETQTLDVRFTTGTATTTVSFASFAPTGVDMSNDGNPDIVWVRIGDTLVHGLADKDGDGSYTDLVIRVSIVGQTEFPPATGEQTIKVQVELLDGLPDATGGGVNTADLGDLVLQATSPAGSTTGSIDIKVVDDVPTAGFTVVGENGAGFGIVHDETTDPADVVLPSPVADPVSLLANGPDHAPIGWTTTSLVPMIDESGAQIGADDDASTTTPSIVYTLTQADGSGFNGQDSGLKATTGGAAPIYLFSEQVTVDGRTVTILVGREGAAGADPAGKVAFVLTIGADKTVTFVQYEAIDHGEQGGSADGESVRITPDLLHLTQTVTDGDGDVATATSPIGFSVTVLDDVPTPSSGTVLSATVREDGLGNGAGATDTVHGNADTPADAAGTSDEASGSAGSLAALFTAGADQPLTFALTAGVGEMALPRLLSGGVEVSYHIETGVDGGRVLVATAGADGATVFTFAVRADGSWSFDLVGQLDHADGDGANSTLKVVTGDGVGTVSGIDLSSAITGTDRDGDSAAARPGSFQISVSDDLPVLAGSASAGVTVHEDGLQQGRGDAVTGNPGTPADAAGTSDEAVLTLADLRSLVLAGADQPVSFVLRGDVTGPVLGGSNGPVTSNGHALTWGAGEGGVVAYYMDGETRHIVLAVTETEAGDFLVDLRDRIDHPAGAGETGLLTINLNSVFAAYDNDLDPVDLSGAAITVSVGNDVPQGNPDGSASIVAAVEEEALDNFNPVTTAGSSGNQDAEDGAPGHAAPAGASVSGAVSLATLFNTGADAPVTIHLADAQTVLASLPALLSRGETVSYVVETGAAADVLRAVVVGGDGAERPVFVLTVNHDGTWTFALQDQLDHAEGAGENYELLTQGGGSVPALDFTGVIVAVDRDGDTATLDGTGAQFAVEVQDDVPVMAGSFSPVTLAVDESALPGANVDSGQPGEVPGSGLLQVSGTLQGLVKVGSDEFADTKGAHFAFNGAVETMPGVTSGGQPIALSVSGNVLTASAGGKDVFTVVLQEDGSFVFTLKGPLDHASLNGTTGDDTENDFVLRLGSLFKAVDSDGDTLVLDPQAVSIAVQDDVPVCLTGAGPLRFTVDESGLHNGQSTGNPDQGRPGETPGNGAVTFTGQLAAFVAVGSDAFADTEGAHFGFSDTASLQGLTSKGSEVSVSVSGNVLTAVADGNRVVFTITLNESGQFTFTLKDQLDHPVGAGTPDANSENSLVLNLGQLFTASDFDGDTVTLDPATVQVIVQDDIPVMASCYRPVVIAVDESGLSVSDGDQSEGNPDACPPRPGEVPGNGVTHVEGDLNRMDFVRVGADEVNGGGAAFSLRSDLSGVSDLTSRGEAVTLQVEGNVLTGLAGGRIVFTLAVEANGHFTFDLRDQIDHDSLNGAGGDDSEAGTIRGAASFSLGQFIQATDKDGDTLHLPADAVVVKVQDDIPVLAGGDGHHGSATYQVLEHGAHEGSPQSQATGNLQSFVRVGADEVLLTDKTGAAFTGAAFSLKPTSHPVDSGLTADGEKVMIVVENGVLRGVAQQGGEHCGDERQTVFEFTVDRNGEFHFSLLGNLDHPQGQGQNGLCPVIDLSAFVKATDADGDSLTLGAGMASFQVIDDVPTRTPVTLVDSVDESALCEGNPDPCMGETVATGSLQPLVDAGEDATSHGAAFSLVMPGGGHATGLTSGGQPITLELDCGVLVGKACGETIFTFAVKTDGSYTFTLVGPVDHRNENGGASQDTLSLDLSRYIKAADTDGDTVTLLDGAFKVQIKDDMPVAETCPGAFVCASVEESALGDCGDGTLVTGSIGQGSGNALFRAGADQNLTIGLKQTLSAGDLPTLYSNGVKLTYQVSGNTLTALAASLVIFTLTVKPDGAFSFELRDHLDHVKGDGANWSLATSAGGATSVPAIDFSKVLVARDGDSDTVVGAAPGSFRISVHDDMPVFETADASAKANGTSGTTGGGLYFDVGADHPGSAVTFVAGTGTAGVRSGGVAVKYSLSADGKTVTGYTDANNNNAVDAGEKVFTAKVNGSGGSDGYTFEQFKALDLPGTATVSIDGSAYGAGPADYLTLKNGAAAMAVLTGYEVKDPGGFVADWYKTASWNQGTKLSDHDVNGSSAGFGVDNNNLDKGEFLRVDFGDVDFHGPAGFNGPAVTKATFQLENYKAGDDILKFVTTFTDGSKELGAVSNASFSVQSSTPGKVIDYIEFYEEKGSVKLDLVCVDKTSATGSVGLEFDVQKSDSDGDTASGRFSVTVTGDPIDSADPYQGVPGKNTVVLACECDSILTGKDGDDILIGNLGRDTLIGGAGKDTFKLTDLSARDLIADYKQGEDRIDLTGLFTKASGAAVSDYVSYDKSTGELKVDADGAGHASEAVTVAIVDATPASHPPAITIVYDDHSHAHQTTNVG